MNDGDVHGSVSRVLFGMAFLALGIALIGWAVLTNYAPPISFDAAVWVSRHLSSAEYPEVFATRIMEAPFPGFMGAFGVMALMIAFGQLRKAGLLGKGLMTGDPIGAAFCYLAGSLSLAVGVVLLGWVALKYLWVERAFDIAMWAARVSPIAPDASPVIIGNEAINQPLLGNITVAGLVALVIAVPLLWSARRRLRPEEVVDEKAVATPPKKSKMVETMEEFTEQAKAFVREDDARPVTLGPDMRSVQELLNGAGVKMTPRQVEVLQQLTPAQRQNVDKAASIARQVPWRKVVIGAVVVYLAWQVATFWYR